MSEKEFEEAIDHLEKIPTHGNCGCITQIRAYVDELKQELSEEKTSYELLADDYKSIVASNLELRSELSALKAKIEGAPRIAAQLNGELVEVYAVPVEDK